MTSPSEVDVRTTDSDALAPRAAQPVLTMTAAEAIVTAAITVRRWLIPQRNVALAVRRAQAECNMVPTSDDEAEVLTGQIARLSGAIDSWEACVKPMRSGLHALRTELASLVGQVTDPAVAVRDEARRRLGGYRKRREAEHRAAAAAVEHASEVPKPPAAGKTRRHWIMEIGDDVALRESLLEAVRGHAAGEGPNHELGACLELRKPALRKLLARPEGQAIIEAAGLRGVAVRSEDRAPTR